METAPEENNKPRWRNDSTEDEGPHFYADTAWARLAKLIRLLPGLTDLIYKCHAQFPLSLLRAVQDRPSSHKVRLHVHSFRPETVRQVGRLCRSPATNFASAMDPRQLTLLRSPCLHSLWLEHLDDRGSPLEHIFKTEGVAPNLSEARLLDTSLPPKHCILRGVWFSRGTEVGRHVGLRHLDLGRGPGRPGRLTGVRVQGWNEVADLSRLHALRLSDPISGCALDRLAALSFPALTHLEIGCAQTKSAEFFDKTKAFLRGLPGLKRLTVKDWDWSVRSLADPDGDTPCDALRTLWLGFAQHREYHWSSHSPRRALSSVSEITALAALYPQVETLGIRLLRSSGDSHEASLYKALGASFPRLSRLALTLEPPGPAGDGDDDESVAAHLRCIMANSAVDANLARQIFTAIACPGLQTMIIRAEVGIEYLYTMDRLGIQSYVWPWLAGLAREWRVEKVGLDGEVKVRQLDASRLARAWKRHARDSSLVHDRSQDWRDDKDVFWRQFETLWPGNREGSKAWFGGWTSLPLSTSES